LTESFHEKLHPMEVARTLSLAMKDRKKVIEPHTYVPNIYQVAFSREDFSRFKPLSEGFLKELTGYLSLEADDLDAHFIGPLRIELSEKDSLAPGEVAIESVFTIPQEQNGKCGIKGIIAVKEGFGKGSLYYLCKSVTSIGRNEENDIALGDPKVSGTHCVIEWRERDAWIIDRESRNGVVVNRKPVQEKMLEEKDEIAIGFSTLQFRKFI